MTPLAQAVKHAFAPDGWLAQSHPHFQPRSGQLSMALAIAHAIEHHGTLVVEAGTGVGKTAAYLIPALLSGQRVLVSTATKTLQDQLYLRDLPKMMAGLDRVIKRAVLKGRRNYVCLHRLEHAWQWVAEHDAQAQSLLGLVQQWVQHTTTGDLHELPQFNEQSSLVDLVTSTVHDCAVTRCPAFDRCHVYKARDTARQADVVVVNHHWLFAECASKAGGAGGGLWPDVDVVIVDEAHQIHDIGVQFLGVQSSYVQLCHFARQIQELAWPSGDAKRQWSALGVELEQAIRDWCAVIDAGALVSGSRHRWVGDAPQGCDGVRWHQALALLAQRMALIVEAFGQARWLNAMVEHLSITAQQIQYGIEQFVLPCPDHAVRWLEYVPTFRMFQSPLEMVDTLGVGLGDAPAPMEPQRGGAARDGVWSPPQPKRAPAWIFTSATLGCDDRLSWFTQRCALTHATTLRVESPFDYAKNAALYVPQDWPLPMDLQGHADALAQWVAVAAHQLGGRTLVLTTTTQALETIGHGLRERMQALQSKVMVLTQGTVPKRHLIDQFRRSNRAGGSGAILVATASFWEGFDVPGQALQLVVIDKLPFPPPHDPVVQAHIERLEARGMRGFKDYVLPETAVKLRQGAGRLIRHEQDRGLLVIGDGRLTSKGYGKALLSALPPMRRIHQSQEALAFLEEITKISTTDCL